MQFFSIILVFSFLVFIPAQIFAMKYVEICDHKGECKKFSRLVMGTDHLFQSDWVQEGKPALKEEEAFKVLDEAVRNGINFFDTAPIYVGDAENRLGKWKKLRIKKIQKNSFYKNRRLNPNRKLYLLSKGGFPFDLFWAKLLEKGTHSPELKKELQKKGILASDFKEEGKDKTILLENVPPGTYASRLYGSESQIVQRVAAELEHTIKNLEGDITAYLMHRDDGDSVAFNAVSRNKTSVETIMKALSAAQIMHRFWMLGWSNWETSRVDESIQLAEKNRALPRPMLNSPYFSLFEMSEQTIHALGVQVTHEQMMDLNFQKGIKLMPYSPLGGFSILDKPEPKWENAKKAAQEKMEKKDPYWQNVFPAIFTPANQARWHRVVKFTKRFNRNHNTNYTVDQMINAYALAHPRTDFLAVGPITIEQVQRTVGALELSELLTSQDLEYLYKGD